MAKVLPRAYVPWAYSGLGRGCSWLGPVTNDQLSRAAWKLALDHSAETCRSPAWLPAFEIVVRSDLRLAAKTGVGVHIGEFERIVPQTEYFP